TSAAGQVAELRTALEQHAALPVTLVGYSWGAWLSFMLAAHHPALVRKLVLVSSGPFEDKYVAARQEARASRLTLAERADFDRTLAALHDPAAGDKAALLARLGALCAKTDDYDPLEAEPVEGDALALQGDLYQGVWEEAAALRKSGRLLELAHRI